MAKLFQNHTNFDESGSIGIGRCALATNELPKALEEVLVEVQPSDDRNYVQDPINFAKSWSFGIRKMCSSCQCGPEASGRAWEILVKRLCTGVLGVGSLLSVRGFNGRVMRVQRRRQRPPGWR